MSYGYNNTCLSDPTQQNCINFKLPEDVLKEDIGNLCGEMNFMCGCSVQNICQDSKYSSGVYCTTFSIYKDLCLDMGGMSGCDDYNEMCSNVSVVEQCKTPTPPLISTMKISSLVTSICNEMQMADCSKCGATMTDCDLLAVYSDLCKSMPGMSQCTEWKTLCKVVPTWPICATNDNTTCVEDPSQENCQNYQLPNSVIDDNINDLCGEMNFMCGCTVDKICQNSKYSDGQYCNPFSVYKDLCTDMGGMSGCTDYKSMCNNVSIVHQCDTVALPIPSTMKTSTLISSMCSRMYMDGCDKCGETMTDCDLLTVYSDLCKSMPDMRECDMWKTMCKAVPDWPICASDKKVDPPLMRMYFHTGIVDYVLFEGWVPRTSAQYAGTWLAVCVMAILQELLKAYRNYLEKRWKADIQKSVNEPLLGSQKPNTSFNLKIDSIRALLRFVEVGWGLIVMLVAMTYNVGLFFSILAGAAIGTLLVGRFINYEPSTSCCE